MKIKLVFGCAIFLMAFYSNAQNSENLSKEIRTGESTINVLGETGAIINHVPKFTSNSKEIIIGNSDIYNTNGKVGIGVTNPESRLHILSGSRAGEEARIQLEDYTTDGTINWQIEANENELDFNMIPELGTPITLYGTVNFNTNANITGNLGIGVANPNEKLEIAGKVKANAVIFPDGELNSIAGLRLWEENGANVSFNTGNVGLGTNTPMERLHVNGSVRGDQAGALRISTGSGYVDIGPKNSSYSHFQTDMSKYYFNKRIVVDEGIISSYNEDLQFQVNQYTKMTINDNGFVGIGTTTPNSNLEVAAEGNPLNTWYSSHPIRIKGTSQQVLIGVSSANQVSYIKSVNTGDDITAPLVLNPNGGNVGIGTITPDCKLTVNGKIKAEEIEVVHDVPESDYVFENDYNLMSLEDVEKYVKEHKHLPEVPSAKEFKENGYKVGQMDDLLLRKVEELTLYVIELKKENDSMKEQINELQK